jgi:hypothetical protein
MVLALVDLMMSNKILLESKRGVIKIKCGCLGCGRHFKAYKDGSRAMREPISHMEQCCPEKMG